MKPQIRLLGIDDGPFEFSDKKTILIGTIMRANGYLEAILKKEIEIDGFDATECIVEMVENSRHLKTIKAIMLDGVAMGGFNVVDIEHIHKKTKLPIITITRDKPNLESIQKALENHFEDWEKRFELIQNSQLYKLETKHNPIYIKCFGISFEMAKEIIKISTIRGVIPEPIRVAHLIASGVIRGESYGKA